MSLAEIIDVAEIRRRIRPYLMLNTAALVLMGLAGGWAGSNWRSVLAVFAVLTVTVLWIARAGSRQGGRAVHDLGAAVINIAASALIVLLTGGSTSPFWLLFLVGALASALTLRGTASGYLQAANTAGAALALLLPDVLSGTVNLRMLALAGMQITTIYATGSMVRVFSHMLLEAGQGLRSGQEEFRHLFGSAQTQARELELLDKVRTAMASELDLSTLLRTVVEVTSATFGYTHLSFYLLHGNTLHEEYQIGYAVPVPRIPVERGVCGRVVRTGAPVLVADVREDPDFIGTSEQITSEICVPLRDEGRVAGVLNLESSGGRRLGEDDLRIMLALSDQVALALGRSRLFADLERQNRLLSALQESTAGLIGQLDLSTGLASILNEATRLVQTPNGYLYHVEPGEEAIRMQVGTGIFAAMQGRRLRRGEGVAGKAWQSGETLVVDDYQAWEGRSAQFEQAGLHAVVGIPLRAQGKVVGVIGLAHDAPERLIAAEEMDVLNRFAELASIALENAQLFGRVQQELVDRRNAEVALRTSEARFRTLVEQLPAITYVAALDAPKTRQYVSPQIEPILGFTQQEWLTDPDLWRRQLHPDDRERVLAEVAEVHNNGAEFATEYRALSRDGRVRWFHDKAMVLRDENGQPRQLQGVQLDITSRKLGEAVQSAVYRIAQAAELSESTAELYPQIHHIIGGIMPADNFYIALLDEERRMLSYDYFVDNMESAPDGPLPLGRGLTEYVLRTGKPLLCPQEVFDQLLASGEVEAIGPASPVWLGVPLVVNERVFGVMALQHYQDAQAYGRRELQVLEFVSAQVAMIIRRRQAESALLQSEQRFRALIENSSDGIVLVSADGTVQYSSPSVRRVLGYAPEELEGQSMLGLVHPDEIGRIQASFARILEHSDEAPTITLRLRNSTGSWRWIEAEAQNLLLDPTVRAIVINYRDVTARKQAEDGQTRQFDRLVAMEEIDRMIASSFDLQRNLATLLDFAVARLGVDCATVLLTDPDLNWLKFGVGRGLRTEALGRTQLALGDGHAGRAALEARMIQVPDLQAEPDAARQEALRAEGVVSYIAVPLMVKGRIQGVLEVLHRAALTPEPDWFKFLEALSAQAAIAIENSTLFGQLQKSHAELRNAYDETIVGWSRALDLRDRETEGHTQRVADMALELARDFGLDEQELVHMRRGALLHDIGKMGIPDRILLKPSSLTKREWEIMRKHPTLAFEMLSPIAHLRAALDIPYCHHERMDGSGYPRGLQGEQIPLTARIFAVVDIWDALRSDRPYRAAWSRAKALRHIKSLAGTQLDARVVKAFLRLINER